MMPRWATGRTLRAARTAGGLLTLAAVGALAWRATGDGAALRATDWTLRPIPLLASLALETAVLALGVRLWQRLLHGATGARLSYRALLTIWWRTSVSRYLPGRAWPFVAAELAREPDVRRGVMAASLGAHAVLALAASLLVGLTFGGRLLDGVAAWHGTTLDRLAPFAWIAVAVVVVLGGAALAWRRRLARLAGDRMVRALRVVARPRIVVLHVASWLVHGVALFVFARAVLPVAPPLATLPAVIGAGALAAGAGTLLGIAPAGLGVREAVLGALLATQLPLASAALLAIAARPWATAAELLLGAVAVLVRAGPAPVRSRMIPVGGR